MSARCSLSSVILLYATNRNVPYFEGRFVSTTRWTSVSLRMRYSIRARTEIIFKLNFLAMILSLGSRAIVPSSSRISQSTAAGKSPDNLHRSIAASVCPARRSTPPSIARSGKICPGLAKSSAFAFGSASALTVAARSDVETPVVVPWM